MLRPTLAIMILPSRQMIAPRPFLGTTILAALLLVSKLLVRSDELVASLVRSRDGPGTLKTFRAAIPPSDPRSHEPKGNRRRRATPPNRRKALRNRGILSNACGRGRVPKRPVPEAKATR